MNPPYENQLIGAFLFGLGYEIGREDPSRDSATIAVNLLQQTPLDTCYGDLIVGSRRCLLIEFKRCKKELSTERGKILWEAFPSPESMGTFFRVANSGHFVMYGESIGERIELKCCTYVDVLGTRRDVNLERFLGLDVMKDMIDAHFGRQPLWGLEPDHMRKYLNALRVLRKGRKSKGTSDGSAWLGVAQCDEGLRFVSASSVDHLLGYSIELERDRELAPSLNDEVDRGPSP